MRIAYPLALLAALFAAAPAAAQDATRVTNTATLSFDAPGGRRTLSSNTVSLEIDRAKRPTSLGFRLPPAGYRLAATTCGRDPRIVASAAIDAATLAAAAPLRTVGAGVPLIVVLDSAGGNHDPLVRETAWVAVSTDTFAGTVALLETGPDSGVFAGGLPQGGDDAACAVRLDGQSRLTVSFPEDAYSYGASAALMLQPASRVFDSASGALLGGATVTLLDASGQPATVFGDDGVSRYPASVVSGGAVADASGRSYPSAPGTYRFPLVAAGLYRLKIDPPAGYAAPSRRTADQLAALKDPRGDPFLIDTASFGGIWALAAPAPFAADVPLDRIGDSSLRLSKVASVREASPGDFVQYRVTLANRGTAAVRGVRLTDTLPAGLRYERGSARGVGDPVVSPDGRTLDFSVAQVAAGGSVDLSYVVTVAPGAPTGEAVNRVIASGPATSNVAEATVRITPLLFTAGFTLVGRVTAGGCGLDQGGKGVAGIRLLLEDGTFVSTDKDGLYHIEGIRPGRHVVQLDTGSIPAAYAPVACDGDTRTAGSAISRFVEADGGLLKRADFRLRATGMRAAQQALPVAKASDAVAAGDRDWFAGQAPGTDILFPTADYNPRAPVMRVVVKHLPGRHVALSMDGKPVDPLLFDTTDVDEARTIALSRWSGIGLKEGDNLIEARILAADGTVIKTLSRIVHSASIPDRADFIAGQSRLVADGLTRPLIAVRVTDRDGRPVRDGTLVSFRVDQPYAAALDAELDQARQLAGHDRAQATTRVGGDDGIAVLALQPTTQAGAVHAVVSMAQEKVTRTSEVRAWLAGAARDWVVVGFGAGTLGYDTLKTRTAALPPGMHEGVVSDGQLALYAKGRIKGSWLLTLAYDSKRTIDRTRGLLGTIDPDRYYTVYGDGSQQGYDAATQRKLYLRLERRDFYALLGDFATGLTDTQLTRYSRTLNGVKAEYQGDRVTLTAFAADTDQLHGRDEIRGNGLSGPYRLSGTDIVPNSDQLRIEVRDRLRPERVLGTTPMTRHIDYDIDPVAGTIRFREPVLGRDAANNPVFIVVDYETETPIRKRAAGGRAAVRLADGRVQLGASVLRDETVGNGTVAGIDLKARPAANTEVRGEYAGGGKLGLGAGRAWLSEAEVHARALDLLVYARSQDQAFGLGQQNLVEAGTRKVGADARVALADNLALSVTAWNAVQLDGPGMRTAAETRLDYRRATGTLFLGGTFADDTGVDGQDRHSRLLTLGGTHDLLDGRLTLGAQAQIAPGGDKASVDFPLRQQLDAAFKVTDGIRLLGGYEIADGKDDVVHTGRVGFDVAPWTGAKLMSTLDQQAIGENGERTYAQYGMRQSLALGRRWTVDVTLDASTTVRGRILAGGFVQAFASTAGGPVADSYQNGGDYLAATIGAGYRAGRWSWNGRLEHRVSDKDTRSTVTSDLLRTLGQGRTLAASLHYSDLTDTKGATAASLAADVALALRPPDSRWSVLERLQFRHDRADAGIADGNALGVAAYGGGFQATLRAVNNLALNYRTGGHGIEATLYYGAKWVRGGFGGDDYTGYIDAIGGEVRADIGSRFDMGVQGSVQHAWDRDTIAYSFGPTLEVSPVQDAWITAGYNVSGYRDRDFEADHYARAGPYITARLKFDQLSLGRAGRQIVGAGQ